MRKHGVFFCVITLFIIKSNLSIIGFKMKIHIVLPFAASLFLYNMGVCAQSYNYESELGHESYKSTDGVEGGVNKKISKVGIKYFPVAINLDRRSPFTELAFLQRKNSYYLSAGSLQYEDTNFSASRTPIVGLGFRAVDSNIVVEINYAQSEKKSSLKLNQDQYYDVRNKNYDISYGWYFLEKTLFGLSTGRKIVSYSAGPGLTSINDWQRSFNGLVSHSVIDFYHDQQVVLDLSLKSEKSESQSQSALKSNSKEIKIKYFPIPEFYFMLGGSKSTGADSVNVGNTQIFGLGFSPSGNINILINKEKFTVLNSDKGSNHSGSSVSMIYKF
jgi:hypothetical protein